MKKTFRLNKLIRDDTSCMLKNGAQLAFREIEGKEELLRYFKAKLLEEALEVEAAQTEAEFVEELADVCEVVRGFAHFLGVDFQKIEEARLAKLERKGGFTKGIVAESITVPIDAPQAHYCLAQPEKYPEVLES